MWHIYEMNFLIFHILMLYLLLYKINRETSFFKPIFVISSPMDEFQMVQRGIKISLQTLN